MRLFVGIEISPAVAGAAADLIELLRARAIRLAPQSRITWVTPERLHVTVQFIGSVDDEKVTDIVQALRPPISVERGDVTVAGVGVFPQKGPPRVVWAGLSAGSDLLGSVVLVVSERLASVGVARESRAFSPHLTLARVREAGGLRPRALLEGLAEPVLGTTPVDAITLFESRLSPKGPTYLAIHRTSLA